MKFAIFAIVLVALCTVGVNADFSGCDDKGQGYWADLDDCTKFHICYKLPGATTWTHVPMNCLHEKAFNAKYGFCSSDARKDYC